MRFLRPEFLHFFWIFLLPVLIFLFFALKSKFRIRKAWEASKLKSFSKFSSKKKVLLICCLLFLMLSLIVFGLSRVQLGYKKLLEIKKPLDIVYLVDLSRSVKTQDVLLLEKRVFRLDLIREESRNFVKNHIGEGKNQMALIAFGLSANYRSYFTYDIGALLCYIDFLDVADFPPEGTDIGGAILRGLEMLDTIDKKPEVFNRPKYKRVFILISDGEDNAEDEFKLDEAIKESSRRRIPIYTIGVGSQSGGYIVEEMDEDGSFIYMTDEDTGEKIISRLEEETLKKIARETGGKYVRSTTGEELSKAFEDVVKRETEKETKTEKDYHDIWQYLFGAAFALCLAIIILYKI